MTQVQLAAKVGVTSFMAVSRWENGTHKPADEFLLKLSAVFGYEPAWFYTDHDPDREEAAA
jgi:transcriptional regulator with XRE-family HTH domain